MFRIKIAWPRVLLHEEINQSLITSLFLHYRKCAHRVPSARLNLWSVPHCASAVLPIVHIPLRTLSIWQVLAVQVPYLYGSNAVSCGSVGGRLTQE